MNHVKQNSSGKRSRRFYASVFILSMAVSCSIVNNIQGKPGEMIEHETEVQSEDTVTSEIAWIELPVARTTIYKPVVVSSDNSISFDILQDNQTIDVDGEAVEETVVVEDLEEETVTLAEEPVRENKLYYVYDEDTRSDLKTEYQDYLWELCKKYDVTEYYELLIAQMYHESGFDETVISKTNDYGLMQINICNHKWLAKELGNSDFLDPYNNMEAGVLIMSGFLSKYSDVHKALVCYNKGESAVINGTYSTSYSRGVISDMDKLVEIK